MKTTNRFENAMNTFANSANELLELWEDGTTLDEGYPFDKDFEEISRDIEIWKNSAVQHLHRQDVSPYLNEIDRLVADKMRVDKLARDSKEAAMKAFRQAVMIEVNNCLPILSRYAKSHGWGEGELYQIRLGHEGGGLIGLILIQPRIEYSRNAGYDDAKFIKLQFKGAGGCDYDMSNDPKLNLAYVITRAVLQAYGISSSKINI